MTVDQLIAEVLTNVRNHFYADRPREFKRDERALMRAIASYGYECDQRNWQFDAHFIYREIMDLLKQIRTSQADITYLPVYLQGAIRKHLGQRAEELSAQAKTIAPKIAKLVNNCQQVEAIRETTDVELLGKLFTNLKRRKRKVVQNNRLTAPIKQNELL